MKKFAIPRNYLVIFLVLLAFLGLALRSSPASAALNFVVNSTADAVDANPGDGLCQTSGGACTLRAAVQEANASPGADTISLPAGTYTLSISGAGEDAAASGDLDISDDLTISGAGSGTTIVRAGSSPGTGVDRVFHVTAGGATVVIEGVDVRFGNATGGWPTGAGGGIFNTGSLTVRDAAVTQNSGDNSGGGIYNYGGTLTVLRSTVSGN